MSEFERCPFCGGDAQSSVNYIKCGGNELLLRASVFCKTCGCERHITFDAFNKPFSAYIKQFDAVTKLWNGRAPL